MSQAIKHLTDKTENDRFLWSLAYVISILFLFYFFFIQLNNRINNSDEFIFLTNLHQKGLWNSLLSWEFNQRPVSHFLFYLTFLFNKDFSTLHWYLFAGNLVVLFLLLLSIKTLLTFWLKKRQLLFQPIQYWTLSMLLVICFHFFPFQYNEIWYWYLCTLIYLLPFAFLGFALYFLFQDTIKTWWSIPFFMAIGGSLELIFVFTALLILTFYLTKKIALKKMVVNQLALVFFNVFQLFNNGIESRIVIENKDVLKNHTFIETFSNFWDKKYLFVLLVLMLFVALIDKYKKQINQTKIAKLTKTSLLLLSCYFVVTWIVTYTAFNGTFGYLRIWMPFLMFLFFFIVILFIKMALKYLSRVKLMGKLGGIGFIVIFCYYFWTQYFYTKQYALSYDAIVSGQETTDEVDSGVLISPNDWGDLKQNLNLYKNER